MGSTPPSPDRILEHRKSYPKPAAPISPVLSFDSFGKSCKPHTPSILDIQNKLHVTSGRAAIALALKHAGINPGDQVLVPAYHCESMISPVHHVGATPVFFRIKADTSIDLDDCKHKVSLKTRAMIVTHYFGLAHHLKAIRLFCDAHNMVLIEDCAHSLFGQQDGVAIGSTGDYAIASTMKFFPVFDGGILASNKHSLDNIQLARPPIAFELKSALTIIERAISYNRLGITGKIISLFARIKDSLWGIVKKLRGSRDKSHSSPASAEGGFGLDPQWINIHTSRASRFILEKCCKQRAVSLRTKNYSVYASKLSNLPGCPPLYKLTSSHIPLVFAARFENCEAIFDRLKREAVPIWRFGEFLDVEITQAAYPVSYDYSQSILQFPCHQEMYSEEIDWIIERIQAACIDINTKTPTNR